MPWVLDHRRHHKQPAFADCSKCRYKQRETTRQRLGCGFMPSSMRWAYVAPSTELAAVSETGICPGYLISLPQVLETARYHPGWERGLLRDRIEGQPSALLCESLDLLQSEMNACEARAMERAGEGHDRR